MRLVILSSEFPPGPGGIGTHAHQLAANLARRGWEIVAVTRQDYAEKEEIEAFNRRQPFDVVTLRAVPTAPAEVLYRWGRVSRVIKDHAPHLLMATGQRSVWLASVLARFHRLPWVAIGHGMEFGQPRSWSGRLSRRAFSHATTAVCVSHYTRERMLSAGIKPQHDCIIPNGADATQFRLMSEEKIDQLRVKMGLSGCRVLLTVGNLTHRKGQDVVIRALPHIRKEVPNIRYLMVGLPTRREALSRLSRELGVSEHVRFVGRVDERELVEVLNCCDVFVLTSRHTSDGDFEGYGIAAVEAALCGKPAIVAGSAGLAEAIVDGTTGICVPEDDDVDTARAVLDLLHHQGRLREMGDAARHRALAEQTWEQRAHQYDELLRSLASLTGGVEGVDGCPLPAEF